MGIREKLNENPGITTGVTIGIICITLIFIGWQIFGGDGSGGVITEMYYTTDDGASKFADDVNKLAPFEKDGKQAVRAYVFSCDDKKTDFIAYLERLTPDALKKLEAARANPDPANPPAVDLDFLQNEGTEVKKPGAGKWVKRNSPEGEAVVNVTCPDGKAENIKAVLPD